MAAALSFDVIDRLTHYRLGIFDTVCPACSANRKPGHRRTKVLRVWRREEDYASYVCQHCGIKGFARRGNREAPRRRTPSPAPTPSAVRKDPAEQARKATWMWRNRQPVAGSIVEVYLREIRKFTGTIPPTIGFLPPYRPDHHPAMIAAFGVPDEPEPGVLSVEGMEVTSVQLTLLAPDGIGPDGKGKAAVKPNKLIVGPCLGKPVVLSPPNDLLGMAITEGLESGLSVFAATGLGVWASGGAGMMPALAAAVPTWIDCVTVFGEADGGACFAEQLVARLQARRIHADLTFLEKPGERDGG